MEKKGKGGKTKLVAKTGGAEVRQWDIMKMMVAGEGENEGGKEGWGGERDGNSGEGGERGRGGGGKPLLCSQETVGNATAVVEIAKSAILFFLLYS